MMTIIANAATKTIQPENSWKKLPSAAAATHVVRRDAGSGHARAPLAMTATGTEESAIRASHPAPENPRNTRNTMPSVTERI